MWKGQLGIVITPHPVQEESEAMRHFVSCPELLSNKWQSGDLSLSLRDFKFSLSPTRALPHPWGALVQLSQLYRWGN